jgi:tRNA uridine 5-carbamoylmethylation protein Kti12
MPLILITGTSTSGKSAVARELVKRSYEAYDMVPMKATIKPTIKSINSYISFY